MKSISHFLVLHTTLFWGAFSSAGAAVAGRPPYRRGAVNCNAPATGETLVVPVRRVRRPCPHGRGEWRQCPQSPHFALASPPPPYHFGCDKCGRVRGRGTFMRRLARTLALPGGRRSWGDRPTAMSGMSSRAAKMAALHVAARSVSGPYRGTVAGSFSVANVGMLPVGPLPREGS